MSFVKAKREIDNIVWIDMEMTGLDVEKHKILEVACLITDQNLNIISEEINIVVHQPEDVLNDMNDWCLTQHAKSGLIKASKESTTSIKQAEEQLLNIVKKYVPKGRVPLAGNSVYMDRYFLMKYMPTLNDYLHYRIIDVSTLKELARRWNPQILNVQAKKKLNHRALDDIKESISELNYYKINFCNVNN